MSLLEAADRIRDGSLSSVALVRAALQRADELDFLGCYISRFDEQAMEAAARADAELSAGNDRGALHGIPVAIKDVIATRECPTTAQSRVFDPNWGRGRDASVVARLRSAGAIIIGKATTMEWALGFPDPGGPYPLPRNPWNPGTWAGGSSSGCGSGVAAGLFCAGIGTDTGGSIRVPSAFCGITGLMPTYGTVPMGGCLPLSYSLDRIGPMARTAGDCAAVLDVISLPSSSRADRGARWSADLAAAKGRPLAGLVIGVHLPHAPAGADRALAGCFEAALSTLAELGAVTVEVDLPYYEVVQSIDWITVVSEAAAYHHASLVSRWQDYAPSTRLMIGEGFLITGPDYVQAQRVRAAAQRRLSVLFREVDLVASPTAFTAAPALRVLFDSDPAGVLSGLNTSYWNPVGNPVLALPVGFSNNGLPLSLQLAAAPFRDDLALAVGALFQAATDWHCREPVPSLSPSDDDWRVGSLPGEGSSPGPTSWPDPRTRGAPVADEDMLRAIAAAGLPASDSELRALSMRVPILQHMRDALYRAANSEQETPVLAFSATPPGVLW